LKSLVKL